MAINRRNTLLSKTRYLYGLQCLRYLWVVANDPARLPPVDARTQFSFDQGHQVGELAKRLYPGGKDIPTDDFTANLELSRQLLERGLPLFEAAFMADKLYARVDILHPAGKGTWDIIEVKSTTSVKDVHLNDIAFQKYCGERVGLTIDRCCLAHINNGFIRNGNIRPVEFFTTTRHRAGALP